jgi:hypothetical protein
MLHVISPRRTPSRSRLANIIMRDATRNAADGKLDPCPLASWNREAGFIEGQRLTESLLREDLAAKPDAVDACDSVTVDE